LDHCEKCGSLINLELQIELEHKKKWQERLAKEPDQLDRIVSSFKNSKWWVVRAIYMVLHAVWVMIMAIVSMFMYMIAWGPG
jgi:hypothetical protein